MNLEVPQLIRGLPGAGWGAVRGCVSARPASCVLEQAGPHVRPAALLEGSGRSLVSRSRWPSRFKAKVPKQTRKDRRRGGSESSECVQQRAAPPGRARARAHTRTRTHTHAGTHTHAHSHARTHTHARARPVVSTRVPPGALCSRSAGLRSAPPWRVAVAGTPAPLGRAAGPSACRRLPPGSS